MKKLSFQIIPTLIIAAILVSSCAKVPFTGRKQTKLIPGETLNQMALESYQDFLSTNKLSTDAKKSNMVKEVGTNIQHAAESYYKSKGMMGQLKNYQWEFNLVDDNTVNAWAMPGGKTVVYTGLLPVAKNVDGLAVVMGHEVAHALAHHGNERMSQGLMVQLGGVALAVALAEQKAQTQNLFMAAYGLGSSIGVVLPFSRKHESEADEIGLYLMAIAGYNPEEAAPFWDRMNASGGERPPEFLSTHPDPAKRASRLKELIPAAKEYAAKYGNKGGSKSAARILK